MAGGFAQDWISTTSRLWRTLEKSFEFGFIHEKVYMVLVAVKQSNKAPALLLSQEVVYWL